MGTDQGFAALGLDQVAFGGNNSIFYGQGPIVAAESLPGNVSIWSWYRSEIHSKHTNETTGVMVNTPAMTSIEFGAGRVVLNSPHPEFTPNIPEIYQGELSWILRRSTIPLLIV